MYFLFSFTFALWRTDVRASSCIRGCWFTFAPKSQRSRTFGARWSRAISAYRWQHLTVRFRVFSLSHGMPRCLYEKTKFFPARLASVPTARSSARKRKIVLFWSHYSHRHSISRDIVRVSCKTVGSSQKVKSAATIFTRDYFHPQQEISSILWKLKYFSIGLT